MIFVLNIPSHCRLDKKIDFACPDKNKNKLDSTKERNKSMPFLSTPTFGFVLKLNCWSICENLKENQSNNEKSLHHFRFVNNWYRFPNDSILRLGIQCLFLIILFSSFHYKSSLSTTTTTMLINHTKLEKKFLFFVLFIEITEQAEKNCAIIRLFLCCYAWFCALGIFSNVVL